MRLLALPLILLLAACGPSQDRETPEPGITISGTAEIGIVK
ncbi:argininosuccinate lyase [Pseudaestuariivita rosea]|nr:argininosuccinate lyase [Pseudaestuariivita rosea]